MHVLTERSYITSTRRRSLTLFGWRAHVAWVAARAAVNNALVNFLFLGLMLVVLNYITFHFFPPPAGEEWERNVYGHDEHEHAHKWFVFRAGAAVRMSAVRAWDRVRTAIKMRLSR